MKQNKVRIFFIILLFVLLWLTVANVREAAYIKNRYTSVSIRYKDDGIKLSDLRTALEKEQLKGGCIPEITAWKWVNEAEVSNDLLKRSQRIAEIIADGNMEATAPMSLSGGNYAAEGDIHGCVLDSETAYSLFGTEKALGNTISVNQTDYIIRGVVKTVFPIVLIQGSNESLLYPNLELNYHGSNKEMGEQLAGNFIFQNGLPTDYVIFDSYFYGKLLSCALCLPIWIFYFTVVLSAMIFYLRQRKRLTNLSFVLYGLAGLVMAFGYGVFLYRITGMPVYLPEKIIPAKWSDFENFEIFFSNVRAQLRQLGYLPPNSRDVYLKGELSRLLLNMTVTGAFYAIIYRWVYRSISVSGKTDQPHIEVR